MTEKWKLVAGYDGAYEVSDRGRVRSIARNDRLGRMVGGIYLKPQKHYAGYPKVGLSKNGYSKQYFIHRLVLEAFVGPCPDGMEACHGNGVPSDNRLKNLRWDTASKNYKDRVKHGTCNAGERHGMAKLCDLDVYLIRNVQAKQCDIAKFFDINSSMVCLIRKGQRWTHVV